MSFKSRNPVILSANANVRLFSGRGVTPSTGVSLAEHRSRLVSREPLNLSLLSAVAITSGQKYNSVELLTWPNSNILFLGGRLQLAMTISSAGTALVGTNFRFSLGAAATASADFSGTNEKTFLDSKTASGAAQALTLNANTVANGSAGVKWITAGAANKMYLNIGTGATFTDAQSLAFATGSLLDLFYIDLDAGA